MQVTSRLTVRSAKRTCTVQASCQTRPASKVHVRLTALDKRVRGSERRADVLVSLPAMLATIFPIVWLASPVVAITANVILCVPILVKIVRVW